MCTAAKLSAAVEVSSSHYHFKEEIQKKCQTLRPSHKFVGVVAWHPKVRRFKVPRRFAGVNNVSESDSFLDEVAEEVRRDRLLKLVKKYAWAIGAVLVLIVGGSGVSEYLKAKAITEAMARGDAMIEALQLETSADRVTALETLLPTAEAASPLVQLQLAAAHQQSEDPAKAAEVLRQIALDQALPQSFRDTARLKLALMPEETVDADERAAILDLLSLDGHPMQALALEQKAVQHLADGQTEEAIIVLQDILELDVARSGVHERAAQILLALGAEPRPQPTDDADTVDG